jgi:RNA polymerase sigma factor (sigma-70 family)
MIDALVTDNIGLVHKYARPFRDRHDYEDIVSAGVVGLAKAAAAYTPDVCAFSTFATLRIKDYVLTYINRLSPLVRGTCRQRASDVPQVLSLDSTVSDADSQLTWVDYLADPVDGFGCVCRDARAAIRSMVESANDVTTCQRKALLKLLDGECLTHIEQTHLYHFRRHKSRTSIKIKEILYAELTA